MKLSDKALRDADVPARGRRVISDQHRDAPRGFVCIVRASGARSFGLRYTGRNGKDRLTVIGEYPAWTLAAARKRAIELRRDIDAGQDPQADRQAERAAPTLAAAVERFCQARADRQKRGHAVRAALQNHLVSALGSEKVADVRRRDVLAILDRLAEDHPRQAALLLTYTKQVFEWCEDRELIEGSPVASLRPARIGQGVQPRARARVLDNDEIRALWNVRHVPGMGRKALIGLKLILATGQRPGEVWGARWAEFEGDWWIIPGERRGKTETELAVPLTESARRLLAQVPQRGEYLFAPGGRPPDSASLPRAVRRCAEALGNRNEARDGYWRPHDLRRTVRTGMAAAGVDDIAAEAAIGHTRKGIAGVYDRHHYAQEKRAALEVWERRLAWIAEGEPAEDNVVELEAAR